MRLHGDGDMYAEALLQEALGARQMGKQLVFPVCAQMDGQRLALEHIIRPRQDRGRRRIAFDKDAVKVVIVECRKRLRRILHREREPLEPVARFQLRGHAFHALLGKIAVGGQIQRDRARLAVEVGVVERQRLDRRADGLRRLVSKKEIKKMYL